MTVSDQDRHYRRALGCFTTGVALITTSTSQGLAAITVNSFTSVSLRPRLVLWCLGDSSYRYPIFSAAERWAVNVFAANQDEISSRFAKPGVPDPYDIGVELLDGVPVLKGALLRLACTHHERRRVGDHLVLIGEVNDYDTLGGDGLTYFRGHYGIAPAPRTAPRFDYSELSW